MIGYRTGLFPDSAMIVFDVQEVVTNKTEITTGKRKFIDVMFKNSAVYKTTGGWGFDEFIDGSRNLGTDAQQKCFNCHSSQAETDFVFTKFKN